MSNGLDQDQDRCSVGPDLGSNSLQMLQSRRPKLRLACEEIYLLGYMCYLINGDLRSSYRLFKGVSWFKSSNFQFRF